MSHPPTDQERLTRWVDDHAQAVFGYLFARLRDRHRADDLVQETFVRAWQARSRYEARGQDRAYLLRIADRLATDHFRRQRRELRLAEQSWISLEPTDDVHLAADREAMANETQRQLMQALGALSEPQRMTLLLRHFGELTFEQIAQELGSPLGTVLSHCRRGLAALRRQLGEPGRNSDNPNAPGPTRDGSAGERPPRQNAANAAARTVCAAHKA